MEGENPCMHIIYIDYKQKIKIEYGGSKQKHTKSHYFIQKESPPKIIVIKKNIIIINLFFFYFLRNIHTNI